MIQSADNLVEEVLARLERKRNHDLPLNNDCNVSSPKQRLVDALSKSTTGLFQTMCDWPMEHHSTDHVDSNRTQHELSGIISISGKLRATMIVSFQQQLVFSIADSFLGARPTAINAEVIDLVGELTNMICGNAKERLDIEGLSLGLPTVISGANVLVAFESGLQKAQLNFVSDHGPLSILLGVSV